MDTEVLAKLIDSKHEMLSQLRQLAIRQLELVEVDDMSRIISLLAVKQRLLNTMDDIEKQLDPFRQQDPEQRIWASPAHRERAREVSARCDAMLQEIMSIERGCESRLHQRRDQAASQIQGMHVAANASTAYLGALDHSGQQFDASCDT
jgi:hypothetical protein